MNNFEDIIAALLDGIEPDTSRREGLAETPARVAKAWAHWTGGYNLDPVAMLKTFGDGADGYDQMVMVKDIPVYSQCEHHLAAIFGRATVAYIPYERVVGLSKLARVVDAFARRLQVQERLTTQIANCISRGLDTEHVAVQLRCRHLCMESRGICSQGHVTITQALYGAFRDEPETRAEFVALAKSDAPI